MSKIKLCFARAVVFGFAAATAFYALYVSSMGRLNVSMGQPDGPIRFLSGLASSIGRNGISEMLSRLRTYDLWIAFLLFTAICFGGELCLPGQKRARLRHCAVKWMAPALIVLAILWVVFRLNNTSLYAWNNYIGGNSGYPLFGTARTSRRDEFALWTPMALSQELQGWPSVNTLIGNKTDVTWISMGGLPAWNTALVFKPLYWGFLIFGSERGLSFLCISRLVILFLVSWKTALLYTRSNRSISIAAAMILTLSPMIQWFFSQGISDVLIYGQGMILAMNSLIRSKSPRKCILYALLNGWLLGCLILVGYPAWIIPAFYIIMAIGICQFIPSSAQSRKKTAGCLFVGLLPSLALLAAVVYGSWSTLEAIRSSAYPGSRLITGGLSDSSTITGGIWNPAFKVDLASLFFPLENIRFSGTNCVDVAPFLGFAPAGAVLSVWHQWKEKKADPVSIALLSVTALFWLFTFFELPAWFCKITLLSQCSRPVFPIGLCEVILLIRARARGGIHNPHAAVLATLISTAINIVGIRFSGIVILSTAQLSILTALYLLLFFMIYQDFRYSGKRLGVFFLCCILLLAGGFINPVQQGLDMLDDFDLIHALRSIENESSDLYAMEWDFPPSDVPLLAGKHCINTDQPYADPERWSAIDPEGEHREIFNRLCHVAITLVDSGTETGFREAGNYIFLQLTREDLAALKVNYLITPRSSLENASLVASSESDGMYIWKLE